MTSKFSKCAIVIMFLFSSCNMGFTKCRIRCWIRIRWLSYKKSWEKAITKKGQKIWVFDFCNCVQKFPAHKLFGVNLFLHFSQRIRTHQNFGFTVRYPFQNYEKNVHAYIVSLFANFKAKRRRNGSKKRKTSFFK